MKKYLFIGLMVLGGVMTQVQAQSALWKADVGHSSILFHVKHFLTPFYGQFRTFDVQLTWNPNDLSQCKVSATVDAGSVDTGSEGRDQHLSSPDFFDASTHPQWKFESASFVAAEGGFVAHGDLTARGTTKHVEVPFQFLGVQDAGKGKKAGVTAEFMILRSDFGLGKAGATLGDEVTVIVNLELNGN